MKLCSRGNISIFKKIAKYVIFNQTLAKLLIKPILGCHNRCYKLAGRYASILNGGTHPKHRILRYKEWFLDNIEHGWVVVDVGCNTGMLPFLLAEKADFVYGIELDRDYIDTAISQRSKDNIEYICADVTSSVLNLDKPVNCITLSNVLEHIEDRIGFLRKLIERYNWADDSKKPFLIRVPLFDREWIVQYKKDLAVEYRLDSSHLIEYTQEDFASEMASAGIKIVELKIRYGEIYAVCEAL